MCIDKESTLTGCFMCVLVLLPVMYVTAEAGRAIQVLTLLPRTGPEALKGRAQYAGIQIAIEDTNNTNASLLDFNVSFHDTQCNPSLESHVVLQNLATNSHRLVILGGGCAYSGSQPTHFPAHLHPTDQSTRQFLPQVSFEDGLPTADGGNDNLVSVRPSVSNLHQPLVEFIVSQGWRAVATVYDSSSTYPMSLQFLQSTLIQENVNTSLVLEKSDSRLFELLQESLLRVVILYMDKVVSSELLCQSLRHNVATSRFTWILIGSNLASMIQSGDLPCDMTQFENVFYFHVSTTFQYGQDYEQFKTKLHKKDPGLPSETYADAAYGYDAAMTVFRALWGLNIDTEKRKPEVFTREFGQTAKALEFEGQSGMIEFNQFDGTRAVEVKLFTNEGKSILAYERPVGGTPLSDHVPEEVHFEGIPLAVFIIICSLAVVGVVFTIAIMIFNIYKRDEKMVKMTSPNLNMVMLVGALMAYISVALIGLDSTMVTLTDMQKLLQASAFLLTIAFTFLFGSLFAKTWRVFLIFKNLNFNGKSTRDEHLLIGVLLLVVLDLVILLPWALADPITCRIFNVSSSYQVESDVNYMYQTDSCSSSNQALWVALLYVLKVPILILGLYVTYQTRHVTLPSLKDSKHVYVVVHTVATMSVVALPVLATSRVGVSIKYGVGSLVVILVVTTTLTMLFLPKMHMLWKERGRGQDSLRFQFTESMKKTQENLGKCSLCCCLVSDDEDKYAQDMLTSEIDTLKKSIKEKDTIIRELNDRLYFGPGKFQEYVVSSKQKQEMAKALARRTKSHPARYYVNFEPSKCTIDTRDSGYSSGGYSRDEYPHRQAMQSTDKITSTPRTHYEGTTMELNARNLAHSLDRLDPAILSAGRTDEGMLSPLKAKPPVASSHPMARHSSLESNHEGAQDSFSAYALSAHETKLERPTLRIKPNQIKQRADVHCQDHSIDSAEEFHHHHPVKHMRTPSPNNDSAIENISPSSASSDCERSSIGDIVGQGHSQGHPCEEYTVRDSINTNLKYKADKESCHKTFYMDGIAVSQI